MFKTEEGEGSESRFDDLEDTDSEKFYKKWGWILVLHNLVDGDLTKVETIENKPFMEVLNWLSLIKEKRMYGN